MPEPTLQQALAVLAKAYKEFTKRKLKSKTAHNAECNDVYIILYAGGVAQLDENGKRPYIDQELSGSVILEGCRNDAVNVADKIKAAVFNEDTTNEVEFQNIDELIRLLNS